MSNPDYSALVAQRRKFFLSGATRPVSWRKAQLVAVKALFAHTSERLYR
jgi:aldehyde dehydrogenase (NAD+)